MTAKFTLEIELGNDAMHGTADVADALRRTADKLDRGQRDGEIHDANGNYVGDYDLDDA